MTSLRPASDPELHLPQAIRYSTSPPRSACSSPKSPREEALDSHGEESPASNPALTPSRAFYIPAGSVSSHEGDSLSDSDDASHRTRDFRESSLLEASSSFQPTSENVIVFEVYTPPSQDFPSQRHANKKFLFSDDLMSAKCGRISEEKESQGSPGDDLKPEIDLLEESDDNQAISDEQHIPALGLDDLLESKEQEDLGRFQRPASSGRSEREVARLQEFLHQKNSEIERLREVIRQKEELISDLESRERPESCSKQTMTSFEDSYEIARIRKENEQLVGTCARYERQNQDLRKEIQECTNDLMNSEKAKGKMVKELKRVTKLAKTYEGEMLRIADFVTKVLSPDVHENWEERDPRHVSNYLASKIEIISSRHSRLQAMHENTLEENEKLKQELQACKSACQSQDSQYEDALKQLNSRVKAKESIIQKLEAKLALKQADENLLQTRPRNQTENFSHMLKGIAEGGDGSPRRSTVQKLLSESRRLTGATERLHGKPQAEVQDLEDITERPCIESDEEMYSKDRSDTDSRNELNKTETPVQVKRQAWKTKQDRRKPPHVRTQSYMQSLLTSEHYAPVLTYKEALKDLREISTRASRAIEESSLTRQQMKEGLTPTRLSVEAPEDDVPLMYAKSSSADRRRKPREIETNIGDSLRPEDEPGRGKKYRSPYVAALLKW